MNVECVKRFGTDTCLRVALGLLPPTATGGVEPVLPPAWWNTTAFEATHNHNSARRVVPITVTCVVGKCLCLLVHLGSANANLRARVFMPRCIPKRHCQGVPLC